MAYALFIRQLPNNKIPYRFFGDSLTENRVVRWYIYFGELR